MKTGSAIVPDNKHTRASRKEGKNARLAARLTGYKIDIKSETQAIESGELPENYMEQMGMMGEEGYTGDYDDEEYDGGEEYTDEYDGSYDEDADYGADDEEIEFVETDDEN